MGRILCLRDRDSSITARPLTAFWRVARKMIGLSLHRSHACVQEEELDDMLALFVIYARRDSSSTYFNYTHPVVNLVKLSCSSWIRDFIIFVIYVDEVLLDATTLKKIDGFPIAEGVC